MTHADCDALEALRISASLPNRRGLNGPAGHQCHLRSHASRVASGRDRMAGRTARAHPVSFQRGPCRAAARHRSPAGGQAKKCVLSEALNELTRMFDGRILSLDVPAAGATPNLHPGRAARDRRCPGLTATWQSSLQSMVLPWPRATPVCICLPG